MVLTPADIYWITRLDAVCAVMVVLIVILLVLSLSLVFTIDWQAYKNNKYFLHDSACMGAKWLKRLVIALIISTGIGIFIPSTRQVAMMYAIPKLVNSEVVKTDLPELYDMGINALKDWLKNKSDNQ